MSGFPASPRLLKGAILGLDVFNPIATVILFQYNPETLTRTLTPSSASYATEDQTELLRFTGPPLENISVDIEIDATDQLETGNPQAVGLGVHPQLASLEMLLYPKAAAIITNTVTLATGFIEVIAPQSALALFVWGVERVLPVRLTGMTITEDFFDPRLNPLHAKVHLEMRVLNYRDLGLQHPGGALFLAHQILKETLATAQGAGTIADVVSGNISL